MESWLQDRQTEIKEEIRTKFQDIFKLYSQFSYVFNLLQNCYPQVILLNQIDERIKQSMDDFKNTYQQILNKCNLNLQDLPPRQDMRQPLNQNVEQSVISSNNQRNSQGVNRNRGSYRSYSRKQKNQVVQLYSNGMSFYCISKKLAIPYKNVMRWCTQYFLEEGQSKKWVNFKMEKQLWLWLQSHPNKDKLLLSDIQHKSLKLSDNQHFKASRGWVRNFLRRCKIANQEIHQLKLNK